MTYFNLLAVLVGETGVTGLSVISCSSFMAFIVGVTSLDCFTCGFVFYLLPQLNFIVLKPIKALSLQSV